MSNHKLKHKYYKLKQSCSNLEELLGLKRKTVKLKIKVPFSKYRTFIEFYERKYNSLCEQCYKVPHYLNKGEKEEIKCVKTMLINKYTNNFKYFNKHFGTSITSTDIVEIYNPGDTTQLSTISKVKKAGSTYKNDITVKIEEKVFHISIKTVDSAPPAIMNHTPRTANVFTKGGYLYHILPILDKIIAKYIAKRETHMIGEDVNITQIISSKKEEETMIALLKYFVFYGTGSKISKNSVNSIYEITKEKKTDYNNLFICDTNEKQSRYIKKMLPKCIMSLRNKGMPKIIKEYNNPWLFTETKTKVKGALHIRIKY